MAPLVSLEDALARLGDDADPSDVSRLLDAISTEIRRLTRRDLEGSPTIYDEVLEVGGGRALTLRHVPVTDILSVRRAYWNGTEDSIYDPADITGGASTTLALAIAAAGAANLKLASVAELSIGDHLRVGSGSTQEVVRVESVGTAGAAGTGVGVSPQLRFGQLLGSPVVEVLGSTSWRLADAARGRLELAYGATFVRVVWRTSGVIEAHIEDAALDWLDARWTERGRDHGLASYSTGDDSESYFASLAGKVPRPVATTLALSYHAVGGGVV